MHRYLDKIKNVKQRLEVPKQNCWKRMDALVRKVKINSDCHQQGNSAVDFGEQAVDKAILL